MGTAQVHQLERPGGVNAGEMPLLQIRDGDQMLTDCPAETPAPAPVPPLDPVGLDLGGGLDESSRQLLGRVQHPETTEWVVETERARLAEVQR